MNRTFSSSAARPSFLVLASLAAATAAAATGCGDSNDTRPAKWSYLSTAIIQPSCATANCHSELSQRSGVRLDSIKEGYYQLLARHFVVPSQPTQSALIGLLEAQGTRRMPPDFALPQDDIDLISKWITSGAPYDGPSPAPVVSALITTAGAGN
jgi:hypothetical protein